MISNLAPFERFQGRRLFALIIVFLIYALWYFKYGPYADLLSLSEDLTLQTKLFYSGQCAESVFDPIAALKKEKIVYIAYLFDVPLMIMLALIMEGFLVSGLKSANKAHTKWTLCLIFPIAYLLFDFLEDSFLALTLVTLQWGYGTLASIFTLLKFAAFVPGLVIALAWFFIGLRARNSPSA